MKIKTILVPTDFSDNAQRAFNTAYEFAAHFGARLVALHVQEESSLRTAVKEGLFEDDCNDEEIRQRVSTLIERRFSELLAGRSDGDSSVEIERLSRRGDPKSVVLEYAEEIGADLIVVGMQGTSALNTLTSLVIGSVAETVIRKSPCPTLVIKRQA